MSDGISVSGGGVTSVAPDELESAGVTLSRLSAEATSMTIELASLDRIVTPWSLESMDAPVSAARAEDDIDQALIVLTELKIAADVLQWSLQSAADGYTFVERYVGYLFGGGGDLLSLGTLLGIASPVGVAGGVLVISDPQLRSHPATGEAIRQAVMSADNLVGLSALVAGIAGAGTAIGLVRNTPVRLVTETAQPRLPAPTSYAERIARIPAPEDDGTQVLVERYEIPGQPDAFVAYLAGTETFDPFVENEPLDMESNLLNVAGDTSASAEIVRQALADAGATAESPVQLVGHSQGGAAEAQIAASGHYNVKGILTFGSPTGQIDIPSEIPAVLVEHDDDFVPAFGGRQDNDDAVLVTRRLYDNGEVPTDEKVPAHLRPAYAETARLMDDATDQRLADALADFNRMLDGATNVTRTSYEFERVTELSARASPR